MDETIYTELIESIISLMTEPVQLELNFEDEVVKTLSDEIVKPLLK